MRPRRVPLYGEFRRGVVGSRSGVRGRLVCPSGRTSGGPTASRRRSGRSDGGARVLVVYFLLVAAGGAFGAMARHGVDRVVFAHLDSTLVGTAIVNVSGSFVLGLLAGGPGLTARLARRSEDADRRGISRLLYHLLNLQPGHGPAPGGGQRVRSGGEPLRQRRPRPRRGFWWSGDRPRRDLTQASSSTWLRKSVYITRSAIPLILSLSKAPTSWFHRLTRAGLL